MLNGRQPAAQTLERECFSRLAGLGFSLPVLVGDADGIAERRAARRQSAADRRRLRRYAPLCMILPDEKLDTPHLAGPFRIKSHMTLHSPAACTAVLHGLPADGDAKSYSAWPPVAGGPSQAGVLQQYGHQTQQHDQPPTAECCDEILHPEIRILSP